MYAICVESSHQRGMGNLFRSLHIMEWLRLHKMEFVFLINNDERSLAYLKEKAIPFCIVNLWDFTSNWEKIIIEKYNVHIWINDRMATDFRHARNVKNCGVKLCSFDDTGAGADLVDQNFCAMIFEGIGNLKGKQVFTGINYMILNQEILYYRRLRTEKKKILITLGGSDTYGVTVKVAKAIQNLPYEFTVVTGYCFKDKEELCRVIGEKNIQVRNTVPSLICFFENFDLAITGGGITTFEAAASGLPCIIIANEHHEEQVGCFFKKLGCSEYLGYHRNSDFARIGQMIGDMKVECMSKKALQLFHLDGLDNVMKEIVNEQ